MKSPHKILIFSIALEGYSQIFQSCINSQREYCSRYNFKYVLVDEAPRKLRAIEAAWLKLFLLRSALKGDFEWIGFLDADCEVRDHAPSFVKDLEKFPDSKKLFVATGFSGRINSGVIFIKNSTEAINFLNKVIENGDKEVPDEDKALYENGHIIHYGKNNPNVQIIEAQKWNNNSFLDKTSYIQHYSGGKLRKKYLGQTKAIPYKKNSFHRLYRKIETKLKINKKPPSVQSINSLLPFYQKKYQAAFDTFRQ